MAFPRITNRLDQAQEALAGAADSARFWLGAITALITALLLVVVVIAGAVLHNPPMP